MISTIILTITLSAVILPNQCTADNEVVTTDNEWRATCELNQKELAINLTKKWVQAVADLDADAMAAHYTVDCVYVKTGRSIAHGRTAVKNLYEEWYNSGVVRVKSEVIDANKLGEGYMFLVKEATAYDEDDNILDTMTILVILKKQVDGGFMTHLKAQIND